MRFFVVWISCLAMVGCGTSASRTFEVTYTVTGDSPAVISSTHSGGVVVEQTTYGFDFADSITYSTGDTAKTILHPSLPWKMTVVIVVDDHEARPIALVANRAASGNASIKQIGKLKAEILGGTGPLFARSEALEYGEVASVVLRDVLTVSSEPFASP